MAEGKLTPKQERFCREYIIDSNGTQAAIRAGYSKQTANEQAARLLAKASVKRQIAELKEEQSQRLNLTADRVLKGIIRVAEADLKDAFDENGNILPMSKMPKDLRLALGGYDRNYSENGMNEKIRLNDRMKALELLGKHLRLFTDKVEHSGGLTLEEILTKSKEVSDG